MEEDYEEGILSHQSPRLVAVRPELLPVPSGSWYGGFLHTLNALYGVPLASETDVYDAGMKRAEVFPRTFEQRNGNQASKQTSGMKRPRELVSPPNLDSDSDDSLPSPISGSSREPPGNEERSDWPPSHSASGSPPQSQQLRPRRQPKRFDLPLLFRVEKEAVEVMACPDSGSDDNIMSESFAKALGLHIGSIDDKTKHFSLANGKTIDAVGQVSAHLSFALGSSPDGSLPECVFYVFRSLAVSVIMGMEFLQQTETLTKHTYRMTEQLVPSMQALRVNSIGKPKRNLVCRLGTYTGLASPDTGSDLDLVSPEFARSRAFNILPAQEELQFADCSIGYTSGVIQTAFSIGQLDDCEGFVPKSIPQVLEFHVLENLTADILLGLETIESLDIFNNHTKSIIPSITDVGQSDVSIIRHIGASEAFFSRMWSKMANQNKGESSVSWPAYSTELQRENARRDMDESRSTGNQGASKVTAEEAKEQTQPAAFSLGNPKFQLYLNENQPVIHDSHSDTSSGFQAPYSCRFFGCTAAPFQARSLYDSHVDEAHPQRWALWEPCGREEAGTTVQDQKAKTDIASH